MTALRNRQVPLKARRAGIPHAGHFEIVEALVGEWWQAGAVRCREKVLEGIEQASGAIAGLYRGENPGKRLLRLVADLEGRGASPRSTGP